jgi:hypothetical protein
MQWSWSRAATRYAALFLAAAFVSACQTDNDPFVTGSLLRPTGGGTVAIDSIDGLPRPVFDRLVEQMSAQAEARKLPIVSRMASPVYRAQISLSAEIEKRQGRIAWAADLFDRNQQRLVRLTGNEPVSAGRREFWQKVDDAALARLAGRMLEAIVAAASGTLPQPAPDAPRREAPSGPAIAFADPR